MKKITIIIFDQFTDIDLFLMWDLLGRNRTEWETKILGKSDFHKSSNGLTVRTHGHISESQNADVVLFASGKGSRLVIQDPVFLNAFTLDPTRQVIGSICSGALILASLGLLKNLNATTHPAAKTELEEMGILVIDQPIVCHGNIATAGGCLSAIYLVGWVMELLYGAEKRKKILDEILPVGQQTLFRGIISESIKKGIEPTQKKCKL